MTWIKLASNFPAHPKVLEAGERAAWLYVCGLCYAVRNETDGLIPRQALALISTDPHRTRLAARLVKVGLWHPCGVGVASVGLAVGSDLASAGLPAGNGWEIHDYKDWQRTKTEKPASTSDFSPNGTGEIEHQPSLPGLGFARVRARGRASAEQNRSREQTPPNPPTGGSPVPVYPRGGHRQRERRAYAEACAVFAVEHGLEVRGVHQAVYFGKARSLEEVQAFIADHFQADA